MTAVAVSEQVEVKRQRDGQTATVTIDYHLHYSPESGANVLTITQGRDTSDYHLRELIGYQTRVFELAIPGSEDAYHVEVPIAGDYPLCTCRGFEARGYCKHQSVLTHAVANGVLDLGWDRPPEVFPSQTQIDDDSKIPF